LRRAFRVEPLADEHDRSAFSCGNDALDRYLSELAGQDQRRGLATVFVLRSVDSDAVAGIYTLSAFQVAPQDLPFEIARRLPHRPLPATLLGCLAVDLRYRGHVLGGVLLVNALARAVTASREIGSMLVVVYAKEDQARALYERYGVRRFIDHPYRLYLPVADAERLAIQV
jgi:GNAT superfamily N-acetyltransferase